MAAARAELLQRPETQRTEFERLLERMNRCYPVREENEFYTVSAPVALLRYAMLEVGVRLDRAGSIASRDDVFYLTPEEQRATLASHSDRRALNVSHGAPNANV